MTQETHFGSLALENLNRWLTGSDDPILLVTGNQSYERCGAAAICEPLLRGREVRRVTVSQPNPRARDIDGHLAELAVSPREQLILAVGGGSVIDTAKLMKAFRRPDALVRDKILAERRIAPDKSPLLAIPTTAGSGSESTHFAVVYADGRKYSCASPDLLPSACFLIPELLESLPAHQRAASSMDALCQGIESYWSVRSTKRTRSLAASAVSTLWRTLHDDPVAEKPRTTHRLSWASNRAGHAINESQTTAAHALSYPLTAKHGVMHGHAVSLMLPGVLEANAKTNSEDCADPRGPAFVRERADELCQMLLSENAPEAASRFRSLAASLGLEPSMDKLGIDADPGSLTEDAHCNQRMANNPRRLSPEAIDLILADVA